MTKQKKTKDKKPRELCYWCGRLFHGARGLSLHRRACKELSGG